MFHEKELQYSPLNELLELFTWLWEGNRQNRILTFYPMNWCRICQQIYKDLIVHKPWGSYRVVVGGHENNSRPHNWSEAAKPI